MLPRAADYESLTAAFRWRIPARYNIAADVCDGQNPAGLALIVEHPGGEVDRYTFGQLRQLSSRLANALEAHGVGPGDRVAILLGQCVETPLTHLAAYRLGAIALPLFTLFGEDALEYRLANSGAKALVTDAANLPKVADLRDRLPELTTVLSIGGGPGALDFWAELERGRDTRPPLDTAADDPALLIYTSGTTGPPKGALHAHRTLLGHMPGVELPHDFFPQAGDLFWTPADWAWAGGLLDVLLPSWHHGVPVLARRAAKFDPEEAFALMARHGVRNVFFPPTALKLMRQVPSPGARHPFALRSIGSGGESLGAEILGWGRETFGFEINEFYGQTECNLVLGNCASLMPVVPGAMGRPIPGHAVAVVDEAGRPLPPGSTGQVAVRAPDPVMFLGYWGNPDATVRKYAGEWLLTGDTAEQGEDGYFRFVGRDDDLITSAGYRIGPAEIEECLLRHPAVTMAAAVGVPDATRTEVVKAFLVLSPGTPASPALADEIRALVRTRLAAYEYPRLIEFVDELPMTATGKIRRRDLRDREIARAAERGNEKAAERQQREGGG